MYRNFCVNSLLACTIFIGATANAKTTISPEHMVNEFCEPLISGKSAQEVTAAAKAAGFKSHKVAGKPVLILEKMILGLSDAPRVCMVQAAPSMTFDQGLALVDAWAARHEGARQGAATRGPDGARVRLWAVPKENKYLLVTEQSLENDGYVLNFILAPLP